MAGISPQDYPPEGRPTSETLADLHLFLDAHAPCDADLEALTNGAADWLALREYADEMQRLRDGEQRARERVAPHVMEYFRKERGGGTITGRITSPEPHIEEVVRDEG